MAGALDKPKENYIIPPICTQTGFSISEKGKASAFAEAFKKQFQPNQMANERLDRLIKTEINIIKAQIEENNKEESESVILDELTYITKNLNVRKAPGRDVITNAAIKQLPAEGQQKLLNINAILKYKYFPKNWKKATLILIKKPNKPKHDTTSYRPISLLANPNKIAEKVIYKRIYKKQKKQTYFRITSLASGPDTPRHNN